MYFTYKGVTLVRALSSLSSSLLIGFVFALVSVTGARLPESLFSLSLRIRPSLEEVQTSVRRIGGQSAEEPTVSQSRAKTSDLTDARLFITHLALQSLDGKQQRTLDEQRIGWRNAMNRSVGGSFAREVYAIIRSAFRQ